MEGAVRLFAGEFAASTLVVAAEDDSSTLQVVTPSGAYCRQVFLTGALTELHESADSIHARLADPTGGFDLACNVRNAGVADVLRNLPRPSFISVSGRAHAYRQGGAYVLSIRAEHVLAVDRQIRDQWVLATAGATLARLKEVQACLTGAGSDERIAAVVRHYRIDTGRLDELAAMIENAVLGIKAPQEAEEGPDARQLVVDLLRAKPGPRGVAVQEIIDTLGAKGVFQDIVLKTIEGLIVEDECYQPQKGYIRLL